ncbi:hypothetical protein GQ600_3706 [Phytophthora cactorum]|nr:hypothetical protein GQ600_3706 [Phytophthora cactorum]
MITEALSALDSADDESVWMRMRQWRIDYEEKPRVRTNDSSGDDSSGDMDGGESDRVSSQSLAGVSVDADSAVVELSQGEIAHIESTASTESKSNAH